ncbi:hypothetical protein FB6_4998 [Serratia marcescens]|nr:hypothetical protein FB6_4998 [Serratia marcescens]
MPSCSGVLTQAITANRPVVNSSAAIRMRAVPMRSPSRPRRGADISAAMPGTAAIMPLTKAILLTLPDSSRMNSVRIGLMEELAS